MEDRLLDNDRCDETYNKRHRFGQRLRLHRGSMKKSRTHRKIEFLLVDIASERTNSTRDCVHGRSRAATPRIRGDFG